MTEGPARSLSRVRGWLLVFVVLLVPHLVSSLFILASSEFRAAAGIEGLSLVTLALTAAGNLSGIVLILTRNRYAPVFFTVYPPALLFLTLLSPSLVDAANARLAALGATSPVTPVQVAAVFSVNVAIVVGTVAYWARSERVRSVFGSRGLELLVKSGP